MVSDGHNLMSDLVGDGLSPSFSPVKGRCGCPRWYCLVERWGAPSWRGRPS